MTDNKKPMLEKADKIAIAVAVVMFLAISAGLMNETNKMHKKYDIKENVQKAQQTLKTKTLDLSKQR